MLTLYYMSATFYQSWRIKNVCNKIAEQLSQNASVVFYSLPVKNDGYDASLATSELCSNRNSAKVTDILWLKGNRRGCSLNPIQTLHIVPWLTFPNSLTSWLPIAYGEESTDNLYAYLAGKGDLLYLLLETETEPYHAGVRRDIDIIRIEKYAVKPEGQPQPIQLVSSHLRKSTRSTAQQSTEEWQKHLKNLRELSVLANQAAEFEYKKNLTEGKTGVVKPDLIPQEQNKQQKEELEAKEKKESECGSIPTPKTLIETDLLQKNLIEQNLAEVQKEVPKTTESLIKPRTTETENNQPISEFTESGRFKATKVQESSVKTATERPATVSTESLLKSNTSLNNSVSKASELEKNTTKTVSLQNLQITPTGSITLTATTATTTTASIKETDSKTSSLSKTNESEFLPTNNNKKRPNLRRNKDSLPESKPLNILVYSESSSTRESALLTLKEIVENDTYTIYPMSLQQAVDQYWLENTALIVVCGAVTANVGEIFVDYFLRGGKVFSICSDILHFILPTYRTAEVREHELVQFSYNKWKKVKMMHHIFCYQPSPVKKNFSTDSDDSSHTLSKKPALVCPRSIELKDLNGGQHSLDVTVLGTEETWNTPSLLLAKNIKSEGSAVFSQVHLESSPTQFEADEIECSILKQNEGIRLEIFADLLSKYLLIDVKKTKSVVEQQSIYQNAYFLGRHELKLELLEKLKLNMVDNEISTSKLALKFCLKDVKPPIATKSVLPILVHSCPEDFSTVDYFDNLKTNSIGRLLIYAPIISSSMNVINELELMHGIAVVPRQQTEGVGRSDNEWLSPLGCAMFSIQLHLPLDSVLGSHLPLIQHIIGAAIVNSLKSHNIYKTLDLAIKWPNDIYANGTNKIGGLVVKTTVQGLNAILNIGAGVNLNNSKPTLCINDMIKDLNRSNQQKLPLLKYEVFIALIFNEIERLIDLLQKGDIKSFYNLYYELWLHEDQTIHICDREGKTIEAKVIGIDDHGFLKVKTTLGVVEAVQPDGNSFDMLKGLIVPKYN